MFGSKGPELAGFFGVPLKGTGVGHLELDATLSGRDAIIVLDTGAASTVVDIEVARTFGLGATPVGEKAGGAGAARMDLWKLDGDLVLAGRLITPPSGLFGMDLSHVAEALRQRGVAPPAAVLGADVLIPREAVIDYGARKLWLRDKIRARAA